MLSERNLCSLLISTFSPCRQPSWKANRQKVAGWASNQSKNSHPNNSKISWSRLWWPHICWQIVMKLDNWFFSKNTLFPDGTWRGRFSVGSLELAFLLVHFYLFQVMSGYLRIHNVLILEFNSQMMYYILLSSILVAHAKGTLAVLYLGL